MTTGKQAMLFKGSSGLRAGWRLLIFLAILLPVGYCASRFTGLLYRTLHTDFYSPGGGAILGGNFVLALLLATTIMGRIERRSLADYGLPLRRSFCLQFWQGSAISFLSLTALMLALRWSGAASFGKPVLGVAEALKYGLMWMLPLFLMALLEDFFYRGYLLFTLTSGIGFWPAAMVTSLIMGGAHYFNPGGHGAGTGRRYRVLPGYLYGLEENRRPVDATGNSFGMELGRGLFLRRSFQRTIRPRAPLQRRVPRPRVAYRRDIWTGSELVESRHDRHLGNWIFAVAARREISEPRSAPPEGTDISAVLTLGYDDRGCSSAYFLCDGHHSPPVYRSAKIRNVERRIPVPPLTEKDSA